MSRLSDPAHVAAQYASSDNFDARVRLYRLYSTEKPVWLEWLFERIDLADGERVLEVGSGTANLWLENAERLPARGRIVLSDRSQGMLEAARRRLGDLADRFEMQRIDVCAVPYPDASFDRAIANHMLYHVLVPGGRCHVGTNDWTHQIEIRELVSRFQVETSMGALRTSGRDDSVFDLQTAARELSACFGSVEVHRRHDHLEVTDASVLGDYVRSACSAEPENLDRVRELEAYVAEEIDRMGSFHLTVAAGVCTAHAGARRDQAVAGSRL